MAEIRVENVHKRFARQILSSRGQHERLPEEVQENEGHTVALDGVSLTVQDGESVSIVGPSGCGKSTLLRVVAGLEHPDRGRILYDGKDMENVPPKDRGIGMVFQNYALYPHWDGYDNLGFFFRLRKRTREIPPRVQEVADMLGVNFKYLLAREPPTLSGGEQQRMAIARCIIRDPSLFLFDEPLSNLDAKLRSGTRVQIKRLLNRFQITSIYVTHDQMEAIAMGDRIAVMHQGRIAQIGDFRSLYDQPVNVFVAGFFGTPPMNFLSGQVEGTHFVRGTVRISLPQSFHPLVPDGTAVRLGVRPEHLGLDTGVPDGAGTIEVVEHLPSERAQLVHLTIEGANLVAQVGEELLVKHGAQVSLAPHPERLYLFDEATGRNLQIPGQ